VRLTGRCRDRQQVQSAGGDCAEWVEDAGCECFVSAVVGVCRLTGAGHGCDCHVYCRVVCDTVGDQQVERERG
jgi:hypothetical protein